jgi:hypothetical protein
MKILIKFPTRNRKDKFFEVLQKYYDFATDLSKIEFLITLDYDDDSMNNQEVIDKLKSYENLRFVFGKSNNKIHAVNRDIELGDWDIILLASDDMIPIEKGYDEQIRFNMTINYPNTDGILWFNDGNRKDLNTLCILGKKYYERFGYIYHPDYKSLWADNEFMTVGNLLKKQIFIDKVIIHHQHPDWGYGGRDIIHSLNSNHDREDRMVFQRRQKINFEL